ncbi:MAG: hypothetical protein WBL53_07180, partial [Pseudonocardiaceae bacterium]
MNLAVAALAAGVLCWPVGVGRSRLAGMRRREARAQVAVGRGDWATRRCAVLLVALAAGVGVVLAGPGGGLAAAMV